MTKPDHEVKIGDVFQINDNHAQQGWVGAFLTVSEAKSWGVQRWVHHVVTQQESGRLYIRLNWDDIDFIGRAVMMPKDENDDGTE